MDNAALRMAFDQVLGDFPQLKVDDLTIGSSDASTGYHGSRGSKLALDKMLPTPAHVEMTIKRGTVLIPSSDVFDPENLEYEPDRVFPTRNGWRSQMSLCGWFGEGDDGEVCGIQGDPSTVVKTVSFFLTH